MTCRCTGRCILHPSEGQMKASKRMYIEGKVYCSICEVCYYHEGLFCVCCRARVRRAPANKNRSKLTVPLVEARH